VGPGRALGGLEGGVWGEFYTVGANCHVMGQNVKLQADVTYSPEAPFTDAASGLLQNSHDIALRLQLQARFWEKSQEAQRGRGEHFWQICM
jgi:hypothetical protein